MLMPCIAVIDEDDNHIHNNTQNWMEFRAIYPDRPFCLLIVEGNKGIEVPSVALSDPKFKAFNVTADKGTGPADDWFDLCGLSKTYSSNVQFVGLFVDGSGSMSKGDVKNSYNQFLANTTAANLTVCEVYNKAEDWIDPFIIDLTPNVNCQVPQPI
jgi:hypothetical protein